MFSFWSALFGTADPAPEQKTHSATPSQLARLPLVRGANKLEYRVKSAGKTSSMEAKIFVIDINKKIVITDIDGTITRSNIKGLVLPVLGNN